MDDLRDLAETIEGALNDHPNMGESYLPARLVTTTSEMSVVDVLFRGKRFKVVVSEAV